jgi:hypothetical protein
MSKPAPLLPPLPIARVSGLRMAEHIVSVRSGFKSTWPVDDLTRIDKARTAYKAGTVELCTGRAAALNDQPGEMSLMVLYAIPRKRKIDPRSF